LARSPNSSSTNARKRQLGGDRADHPIFRSTECVAGVQDMRFQELMRMSSTGLGIRPIDRWVSMSNLKHDALKAQGMRGGRARFAIPDRLVPLDAAVEIEAKKAAGYFAPLGIPRSAGAQPPQGGHGGGGTGGLAGVGAAAGAPGGHGVGSVGVAGAAPGGQAGMSAGGSRGGPGGDGGGGRQRRRHRWRGIERSSAPEVPVEDVLCPTDGTMCDYGVCAQCACTKGRWKCTRAEVGGACFPRATCEYVKKLLSVSRVRAATPVGRATSDRPVQQQALRVPPRGP